MSDLISRQKTLKHIDKIRQGVQMMDDTRRASIIMNGMDLCEKVVRNQPSAEPGIIRCRDCKFWTHIKRTNRYWCNTDEGLYDLNPSPDDFCSRAERKE